jgi:hypothetical protein
MLPFIERRCGRLHASMHGLTAQHDSGLAGQAGNGFNE